MLWLPHCKDVQRAKLRELADSKTINDTKPLFHATNCHLAYWRAWLTGKLLWWTCQMTLRLWWHIPLDVDFQHLFADGTATKTKTPYALSWIGNAVQCDHWRSIIASQDRCMVWFKHCSSVGRAALMAKGGSVECPHMASSLSDWHDALDGCQVCSWWP